ncbi:type I endonuclease-methyltransferase fusion protein [Bacteroidia bacterium]|nr:type I endonuclease-methyltransferase fusion protein [Bacteroidia bacterium]
MKNLDEIFQALELKNKDGSYKDGLCFSNDALQLSSRIKRCLEQIKPDAFFCFDNKPLILFFVNPLDKLALHKQIWNFNEVPVVIIVENNSVEIFNGFQLLESGENKGTLSKLGNQKLNDFTYFNLVTGKTWETYEKELNYKNRVDYKLLDNIGAARKQIIKQFSPIDENDEETKKRYVKITNALLGKVIFVRYLIDRNVKIYFEGESKERTKEDFCTILQQPDRAKQFFNTLADKEVGFNGDLFSLNDSEYQGIPQKAYSILIKLLQSQEISTGQQSLFDLYDFSIIPIEFISNVYESFVGINKEKKKTKENKENDNGVHYTPLFLVDYILAETVDRYVFDNKTFNCKILDPSCGSGVFLVETLRKLIERYKESNPLIHTENQEKFKEEIKKIAKDNIFGVDSDESAVQVAIFSIYLTLLNEMDPPEIPNFKFPPLLNTNFFCADFFDETKEFNTIFKKNDFKFDFIIGNPPWFRGQNEKKKTKKEPLYVQYIKNRKKKEKNAKYTIDIGNKEIAQAFLLRSGDFCAENTRCALIVTSKALYNLKSKDFREYFLHNYFIERVFELAPVRREVFDKSNDKAIAPACVLFFRDAKEKNTDSNLIEHIALKPSHFFSMFKIFSIYRHDIQTVQQNRLKDYDWLWKVLVYGSYLDFNFINRLNNELDTIQNIRKKENILFKQGLKRKDAARKNPIQVTKLIDKPFLDTQKKQLHPFMIVDSNQKWNEEYVGYIYKQNDKPYLELFQPYSLLIAGGIFKDLTSNAAINKQERVFTSSVRALKIKDESQLDIIYSINIILCSSLFSYYMLNTGVSAGIEREESEDTEIENMWYFNILNVIEKAQQIEDYQVNKNKLKNKAIKEVSIRQQCDDIIFKSLELSIEEKELLNYANDITIPLQMQHKGFEKLLLPCKIEDNILIDYANLFTNRFASNFEKIGKKFAVEIWHTQQIVGMFFKVIAENEYTKPIVWKNKQNDTNGIFQKIIELGATKITDQLFVQKDIRGFEKEYFYLFKPNEKRLWHKAVGYLDVEEFADAILKAGRDKNE